MATPIRLLVVAVVVVVTSATDRVPVLSVHTALPHSFSATVVATNFVWVAMDTRLGCVCLGIQSPLGKANQVNISTLPDSLISRLGLRSGLRRAHREQTKQNKHISKQGNQLPWARFAIDMHVDRESYQDYPKKKHSIR